ncbi:cytochrome b [Chitinolyticbacter meiyuanensis]|uniref:cytochrome b n=1 Tax=Chitinolyticbacter meiyuanensis TaxID=682798 RepID=UPI0011E5967D|nr:cytochrome b [Chitinolyticbacter meiyuanensis]
MAAERYDGVQKSLHWLIALLILSAFGLIWYIGSLPLSPLKFKLYSYHKWIGISVLILFVARLAWRLKHGTPHELPGQPAWQTRLAAGVHHLLYLLMALVPLLGWAMSSAKGFPVVLFGVVPLPDFVPKDEALGHILAETHEVVAYTLLVVVGLHVAGALKHHFIDRDITLKRMLPGQH